MISYRLATLQEIDLLVQLRVEDLQIFTNVPFPVESIQNIRNFYELKIKDNSCYTIFGYDQKKLIATGTVYFYDCLPSNANPIGKVGYITNIWTDEPYRRQGIASNIVDQLMKIAEGKCGILSLSSSASGEKLYLKKGFVKNKEVMSYKY